jgi:hypothetical protein
MATVRNDHGQAMSTPPHRKRAPAHVNSALCAGASARMLWAVLALALLWVTIAWALS